MFLDHKTLYYDVETFLFYVLIEWNKVSATPHNPLKTLSTMCNYSLVGYFSKEKSSPANYNLSCIMTLPNHQRKGYGNFLIDFSYMLSRKEGKQCSPEKPLSDLGLLSYTSYWNNKVFGFLVAHRNQPVDVEKISAETGISINDILAVLEHHNCVRWLSKEGKYVICVEEPLLCAFEEKLRGRQCLQADPSRLRWIPFTCTR